MGRVPLARRNLLAEPRRLAAGVTGIGLALMLILLLGGMWNGVRVSTTRYQDSTGAAMFVVPQGTRTLFAEGTQLPANTADAVRATQGVDWAAPAWGLFAMLTLHDTKVATVVIGSVPGQPGGAWALTRGRAPAGDGEVAIDRVLASRYDLDVGDRLPIADGSYRIVGITRYGGFMTRSVFATHRAVEAMLRAPGRTSIILVGTRQPDTVRARLAARGLDVVSADELRQGTLEPTTKVFDGPLRLMVVIAFAAGVLIIALTTYTQVVERRREYGILKAIGADGRRLASLALAQTLVLAVLGLGAGGLLFAGGRALLGWLRPQFEISLTPGLFVLTLCAALAMALLAAIIPARRLIQLDPATAYRGAS
jgi:putative ABC transport system permease protein